MPGPRLAVPLAAVLLGVAGGSLAQAQGPPEDPQGPYDRRPPGLGCDALATLEAAGCHTWVTDYVRNDTVKDPRVLERGAQGERVFVGGTTEGFSTQDSAIPYLAALDADTGEVLWGWSTQGPGGAEDSEALVDIVTGPDGDRVYATGVLRDADLTPFARTWAFDAETGDLLWSRTNRSVPAQDHDGRAASAVTYAPQGLVVLGTYWEPAAVHGLDPETGETVWNTTLSSMYDVCYGCLEVVPSRNALVTQGTSGSSARDVTVAVLDLESGSIRWTSNEGGQHGKFPFHGDVEVSPDRGLVYSSSTEGLFLRDGAVTARSLASGDVVWDRHFSGDYTGIHLTGSDEQVVLTGARQAGPAPFNTKAWAGGLDAATGVTEWTWTHQGLGREVVADTDGAIEGFSLPDQDVSVLATVVDAGPDGDDDALFASVDEDTGETVQTVRYSNLPDQAEALAGWRHVERGEEAAFAAIETWPAQGPTKTTVLRYELDRFRPDAGVDCLEASCTTGSPPGEPAEGDPFEGRSTDQASWPGPWDPARAPSAVPGPPAPLGHGDRGVQDPEDRARTSSGPSSYNR